MKKKNIKVISAVLIVGALIILTAGNIHNLSVSPGEVVESSSIFQRTYIDLGSIIALLIGLFIGRRQ